MPRPEHQSNAKDFYGEEGSRAYARNTRMLTTQREMTLRAMELMGLATNDDGSTSEDGIEDLEENSDSNMTDSLSDDSKISESSIKIRKESPLKKNSPCMILDAGCGCGISAEILRDNGHFSIGLDISIHMLNIGVENDCLSDGDSICLDMGNGLPFRPGTFDGCISISAIQWLCNADTRLMNPYKRLHEFFKSIIRVLKRGASVVLQFYPDSPEQIEMITSAALKSGLSGGLVVDYPESAKAKKHYLVLTVGHSERLTPISVTTSGEQAKFGRRHTMKSSSKNGLRNQTMKGLKGKAWVMSKKDRYRNQGKNVKSDSKYTARKRKPRF